MSDDQPLYNYHWVGPYREHCTQNMYVQGSQTLLITTD